MSQKGFVVPILIAVVALAAIGAGVAIYATNQGGDDSGAGETGSPDQVLTDENGEDTHVLDGSEDQVGAFTGTITELLASGSDLTCTFNQVESGATVNGVVYMADRGQRLRGDFVMTQADGTATNAHLIRDGGFNYTWFDEMTEGYKVPVTKDADVRVGDEQPTDFLDDSIKYSCERWLVQSNMFTLPTDRQFVDISENIQQIQAGEDQLQQAQCAACEQLEGPVKTQCQQALGC